MVEKVNHNRIKAKWRLSPLLSLAILFALVGLFAVACGVESGDRRPADVAQSGEFIRQEIPAFEQFRIDLEKDDDGNCSADPADIEATEGQRIRLAVQLKLEGIAQGVTGSIEVTEERDSATYQIPGLVIANSGGALSAGITGVDLALDGGARTSYDFNVANNGSFDILCDGTKIGTMTAKPLG